MELAVNPQTGRGKRRTNLFQLLLVVLVLLFAGLLSYKVYELVVLEEQIVEQTKQQERQTTVDTAGKVNGLTAKLATVAEALAKDLTDGKVPYAEIETRLRSDMLANELFNGLGVAFDPFVYDPKVKLHSPFIVREKKGDDGLVSRTLHEGRDYSEAAQNVDWYVNAHTRGGGWSEPRFGNTSKRMVANYSTPFYRINPATNNKEIAGVVLINFDLEKLKEILFEQDYGKTGYPFMVSNAGTFLVHPIDEYVTSQKRISSLDSELGQNIWQTVAEAAQKGQSGAIEVPLSDGKQEETLITKLGSSQLYYEPVKGPGWLVGTVYTQQQERTSKITWRQGALQILIYGLVTAVLITLLAMRPGAGGNLRKRQWIASGTISLFLIFGIVCVWFLVLYTPYQDDSTVQLTRRADVDAFLKQKTTVMELGAPAMIPTGVHIQTVEITGTSSVSMNGYIWQKFTKEQSDLEPGVFFPEATSVTFNDAYTREDDRVKVIGQSFQATFREGFQFGEYPFDKNAVSIRIQPKDFDKNVVLVPDLGAYTTLNPLQKPGVELGLTTPGWQIESSYFSYVTSSYNSNFGIKGYKGQTNFPELHFTMAVQRDFLNPFISNLLPVFVIIGMLFALLLMVTGREKYVTIFGFNTSGIIGGCSALFFSVLLSHSQLRNDLAVNQITYLEYFYFVAYAAILLVSVNTYVFSKYEPVEVEGDAAAVPMSRWVRVVRYEDNLIPKIGYWPVSLLAMFIITVLVFY